MSHHATEDLAIMRSIPGLAVAAPGDPEETSAVMADLSDNGGPAYLRLGKAGETYGPPKTPSAPRAASQFALRDGRDVVLLSIGAMLPTVVTRRSCWRRTGCQFRYFRAVARPFDESCCSRRPRRATG